MREDRSTVQREGSMRREARARERSNHASRGRGSRGGFFVTSISFHGEKMRYDEVTDKQTIHLRF